jgi:hypothetical protein
MAGDFYDDGPDVDDLIRDAEEATSFEDYLEAQSRKGHKWTAKDAAGASKASSSQKDNQDSGGAPSSSSASSAARQPDKSQAEVLAEFPGLSRTENKDIPAPEPVIVDVGPSVTTTASPELEGELVLTIHEHPMIGTTVQEERVFVTRDAEAADMYLGAYKLSIDEMTLAQCVALVHKIERKIRLEREQQNGIRRGIEVHLNAANAKQRAEYLELDKQEREKYKARRIAKPAGPTTKKVSASTASAAKTPAMKTALTLQKIGMDAEAIKANLRDRKSLDQATEAYIDSLFVGGK